MPAERRLTTVTPKHDLLKALAAALLVPLLGSLLPAESPRAQVYVDTGDTLHPRVRYADSLVSLNDRCIVRMTKLSRKTRPVYVNGRPIGFC